MNEKEPKKRAKINIDITTGTKVETIPEIVRGGEAKASVLKLSKLMVKGEIRKFEFNNIKQQRTLASRIYKYGSDKDMNLEVYVRNENGKFLVFVKRV